MVVTMMNDKDNDDGGDDDGDSFKDDSEGEQVGFGPRERECW